MRRAEAGARYAVSMKPHPRIRKTIKWGGAAVTLLLVVVWIDSIREFMLTGGEPRHRGLWRWDHFGIACGLPVLLAGLTTFTTLAAWRFDILARRRERVGICPKCGYDRAGIAKDAMCPECGHECRLPSAGGR